MNSHLENLKKHIPNILGMDILDVGCGRGGFVNAVNDAGGTAIGLDIDPPEGIDFVRGKAEYMPFLNGNFDFVNCGETIEHVEFPRDMLMEIKRVLAPHGMVYLSAPNRFGLKDPHFHVYGLNWMPRSWAVVLLSILGKHKDYTPVHGIQRIDKMNYYTYGRLKKLLEKIGFEVIDIREKRLEEMGLNQSTIGPLYWIFKTFYFDTFHLLLKK